MCYQIKGGKFKISKTILKDRRILGLNMDEREGYLKWKVKDK